MSNKKNIEIDIGINGAFLTRRWEEPENFMKLTRELGFYYHEFCADVIDPFFSGDYDYQKKIAREVKKYAYKYRVKITDYYTGMATHRFHGLSHSNPSVRERMKQWIIKAMEISKFMGVDKIGGHWDAISVEVLNDKKKYKKAKQNIYNQFREISKIAKQKDIVAIYNEQMYIPSEIPWTIEGTYEFLYEVNKDNNYVPIYITVDTGHQAGANYGSKGKDRDYLEWLKNFACVCEVIHLQQTTPNSSNHWPFTNEYNKIGHVNIDDVIESIVYSHKNFSKNILSKVLKRVKKTILMAEIIPSSTQAEKSLLNDLKETHHYLRKFIPEGGLKISL